MIKTSFLKIIAYIGIYFVGFIFLYTISLFAGLYKENTSEDFKNKWNHAYITNDKNTLLELYKGFGDGVKQNKVDVCEKEGFYSRDGNTYFCKDKSIIIFQKNTIKKTANIVFTIDYIILINIISLLSSLILFLITYSKNKYTYASLSRKGFTYNDIEKKYIEVYGILKEDVNAVNFTKQKVQDYIDVLYAYKLLGKGRFQGNVEKDLHELYADIYKNGLYEVYRPYIKIITKIQKKYILNIYTIIIFGTMTLLVMGINLNGGNWSGIFSSIDLGGIISSLSKLTSFQPSNFNNVFQFIIAKSILLSILIYDRD